ncbi:flagellar protein FlaG [Halalkalibacter krulwichiae]|uniref:Flagellar protein FlaG n=1 Tax=Halalkalibacter krulwichiae TaxID=199441 RepID=A0A1X9MF49_9BACI|nr:flagellar protein FlaG [Halalkalibacter krulwichiae]ARK32079.1 flagellar protein FlaG [Halalkalibacter krulwichiae]
MDVKSTSVTSSLDIQAVKSETQNRLQIQVEQKEIENPNEYPQFPSKEALRRQVESMNELLKSNMTSVKFNMHDELNRSYIQLVSKDNDEIIREIPSEEFLNMVASMLKHAGLLIDKKI